MTNTFFTDNAIQAFLLRAKRQLLVPPSDRKPTAQSRRQVAAMLADMAQLGFTFDGVATAALLRLDAADLQDTQARLMPMLQAMVGANVRYTPLFRRFPNDIPDDFSYLVNRILGHVESLFGVSRKSFTVLSCGHILNHDRFNPADFGACPICQQVVPELTGETIPAEPFTEATSLKLLGLAKIDDVLTVFANTAASRTSISAEAAAFLRHMVSTYPSEAMAVLPAALPFKENVGVIAAVLLQAGALARQAATYVKTPTDVLRVAVGLVGGDVSLAEACKFKLRNAERKFLMQCLEGLSQTPEQMQAEMVSYVGRWVRLGEVLHVRQFAEKYPKTALCFHALRNDARGIETWESRVAKLVEKPVLTRTDSSELLLQLSQRPGEFARRLDLLLSKGVDTVAVLKNFKAVAAGVSTTTLLTLSGHFRVRGEVAAYRAFMPKGAVAKMFITPGDARPALSLPVRSAVLDVVQSELVARFSKLAPLGKVFLDDALSGVLLPASQRSASSALIPLPRGSRVPLAAEKDFLRMFLHWTETAETGRVDVDLAVALYDADWDMTAQMDWTSMKAFGRSTHSGDVQSGPAPHGGAEFVDLDLQAIKASGAKYAAVMVYSYTGQPFNAFTAVAGVMERDEPGKGKHFEAQAVTQKFDVTSPTTAVMPMAVDLETNELLWMDMGFKGGRYASVGSTAGRMTAMARALTDMHLARTSLYDLFELHVAARGQMVSSAAEADVVLGMEQLLSLDDIAANWM